MLLRFGVFFGLVTLCLFLGAVVYSKSVIIRHLDERLAAALKDARTERDLVKSAREKALALEERARSSEERLVKVEADKEAAANILKAARDDISAERRVRLMVEETLAATKKSLAESLRSRNEDKAALSAAVAHSKSAQEALANLRRQSVPDTKQPMDQSVKVLSEPIMSETAYRASEMQPTSIETPDNVAATLAPAAASKSQASDASRRAALPKAAPQKTGNRRRVGLARSPKRPTTTVPKINPDWMQPF